MSLPTDKQDRKERPVFSGLLEYFPDACAEVAHVSYVGNQQHNPGQPMHWARHKSTDHLDCIGRHLMEAGQIDDDGLLHSAKLAWRALANLQIELEKRGQSPQQVATALVEYAEQHFGMSTVKSAPSDVGEDASKYEGDWNWPDQSNGIWTVRGGKVWFTLYGETKLSKPIDRSMDTHRAEVDNGHRVRNTRPFNFNPPQERSDPRTPRIVMLDRLIELNCPPHIASQIVGGTTFREGPVNPGKVVYISGPMRGLPEDNFPVFDKARNEFKAAGWTVISPADVDRIGGRSTDNWVYIERDYYALKYVAKMNGAIAMLPDWESSKGAAGELFLSRWSGIKILDGYYKNPSRPLTPGLYSSLELTNALDTTLLEQK